VGLHRRVQVTPPETENPMATILYELTPAGTTAELTAGTYTAEVLETIQSLPVPIIGFYTLLTAVGTGTPGELTRALDTLATNGLITKGGI
jgi:hypothetical protein